jgi:hypothetical protein
VNGWLYAQPPVVTGYCGRRRYGVRLGNPVAAPPTMRTLSQDSDLQGYGTPLEMPVAGRVVMLKTPRCPVVRVV